MFHAGYGEGVARDPGDRSIAPVDASTDQGRDGRIEYRALSLYMLVVGSRGHDTFAGMLLGSVSQHCVQHAPCPVLVVPQDTTPSQ